MGDRNTFKGCVLAFLAGVCFATGVSFLTDERGVVKHGACKEINFNNWAFNQYEK